MPGAAHSSAVVLVSGGMDSAVVLALARERGLACHALSVSYGQRHAAELDAAAALRERCRAPSRTSR
jgi:7-cyano-7-deazaguanine synthase